MSAARVLVVDDDDLMRALVAEMLETQGYAVEQAESGVKALEQIAASPPALVVLDLWMPGVTGWDVIERLAQVDAPPSILAMSGMELRPPSHLRVVASHVRGFLAKPFTCDELLRACAAALRARSAPLPSPAAERRRERRRNLFLTATLLSEHGLPAARAEIVSISRAGAELQIGAALPAGTPLTLAFDVPGGQGEFRVTATVRSRTAATLGVEFADLSADDRRRLGELLATRP